MCVSVEEIAGVKKMVTEVKLVPSSIIASPTSKMYSEQAVEKLLSGIHMLGGTVCHTCGTVHIRSTKCPVCTLKKYI